MKCSVLTLFIIALFAFSSCFSTESQESNDNDTAQQLDNKSKDSIVKTPAMTRSEKAGVKAIVGGNKWESSDRSPHSKIGCVAIKNTHMNVMIQAYGEDGSYMALNIVSVSGLEAGKTYDARGGAFQGQYKPDFTSSDVYLSTVGSGRITIEQMSANQISGNFSFIGGNPNLGEIEIEKGEFDIALN